MSTTGKINTVVQQSAALVGRKKGFPSQPQPSIESQSQLTDDQSTTSSSVLTTWSNRKPDDIWYCHCCTAKNTFAVDKCRVCGRPESYAMPGYHLPFHGDNAKVYRPSQIINVLEDVHEVDSEKWTALHSACAQGNVLIVKQLLKYKSQIEAVTDKGHTPIHLAVHSGSVECVQELIRRSANVNVSTYTDKTTPLHMAAEMGYAKTTQMLIQAAADVHALNILQRTPLHCAAISGRSDIALLLLRSGAKLHALDVHGWEPCQIAELFSHTELQELLIREGMTEKQAVMKDLPPAKWHSDVWHQVVKMQTQRRYEYQHASEKIEEEQEQIKLLQENARKKRHLEHALEDANPSSNSSLASSHRGTASGSASPLSRAGSSIASSGPGFTYKNKTIKYFS
jgi:ankyrin repeat protein